MIFQRRADRSALMQEGCCAFRFLPAFAAGPGRNRRPMRTRLRMPQEGANLICRLSRQDVLKLTCLLLDFGFTVHGKRVREEPLREPMSANDIRGSLASTSGEFNNQRALAN